MVVLVKQILRQLRNYDLKGPSQAKRLIPGSPKRPPTPFIMYFQMKQHYYDVELQLVDQSRQERSRKNGKLYKIERNLIIQKSKEEWNQMTTIEKEPYVQEQQEQRVEYFIRKKQYIEDFRYFRPTAPQSIYRNQMVGSENKRKEGDLRLTQEEARNKFKNLQNQFKLQYVVESEEVKAVYEQISRITLLQDNIQQIRQRVYSIPDVLNKAISDKLITQYYEERQRGKFTFGEYIAKFLSPKQLETYKQQLIRLSELLNESPDIIEEIIAYKKAHLHVGEYNQFLWHIYQLKIWGKKQKSKVLRTCGINIRHLGKGKRSTLIIEQYFMINKIFETLEQKGNKNLNSDQKNSIAETLAYLEKHKIELLFQQLLAVIIEQESNQPRLALVDALRSKKQKIMYFTESDFEILFQNYDPYNTKSAKITHLIEALLVLDIVQNVETLKSRYPSLTNKDYLYQDEFEDILKNEYIIKHK